MSLVATQCIRFSAHNSKNVFMIYDFGEFAKIRGFHGVKIHVLSRGIVYFDRWVQTLHSATVIGVYSHLTRENIISIFLRNIGIAPDYNSIITEETRVVILSDMLV
jgi:hypothetical protein